MIPRKKNPATPWWKRQVFWLALLFMLPGGCGLLPAGGPPAPAPTYESQRFEALSARGNPAMLVALDRGAIVSVLILDARNPPHSTWVSADGASVSFHAGVLNATRGFGTDLISAEVGGSARLVQAAETGRAIRIHRMLDGEDQIIIRSFVCDISPRGARRIEVGQVTYATTLMEEKCTGATTGFTNLYWLRRPGGGVSGDADILQSRQWAGPGTGPVELRLIAP